MLSALRNHYARRLYLTPQREPHMNLKLLSGRHSTNKQVIGAFYEKGNSCNLMTEVPKSLSVCKTGQLPHFLEIEIRCCAQPSCRSRVLANELRQIDWEAYSFNLSMVTLLAETSARRLKSAAIALGCKRRNLCTALLQSVLSPIS